MPHYRNVMGSTLAPCCQDPMTGFYRDGFCRVGAEDVGVHAVCAVMTEEFLEFSRRRGNDLATARPEVGFPGLGVGDRWCLCAARWQEALEAECAPRILLAGTAQAALEIVHLADLKRHALDLC